MLRNIFRCILVATVVVVATVLFASCSGSEKDLPLADTGLEPIFTTWEYLGDLPGAFPAPTIESLPPDSARPWAGTVSHHLLAHNSIDRWFLELAKRRKVKTFYILSPSHWGLSSQPWSLSDGSWAVANGHVKSNKKQVHKIAKALGVPLEHSVFEPEHGISTLIPYIAEYFPRSDIVAIAYAVESPLNQARAQILSDIIESIFDRKGKERDFLLISADFSHHSGPEETAVRDARSRVFFTKLEAESWVFAGCDNRPGMYVLAQMLVPESHCSILFHTDSWRLSGHDPHDITSYFFTFFWDEQKGLR